MTAKERIEAEAKRKEERAQAMKEATKPKGKKPKEYSDALPN